MIVDVALATEAISNRVADQVRKAGVIERPMGAQRHDIVQRRHPWSQVLGKEIKKAGHGHGARAIGDDDQHSTAIDLQTIGPAGDDGAHFLIREEAVRRTCTQHSSCVGHGLDSCKGAKAPVDGHGNARCKGGGR